MQNCADFAYKAIGEWIQVLYQFCAKYQLPTIDHKMISYIDLNIIIPHNDRITQLIKMEPWLIHTFITAPCCSKT